MSENKVINNGKVLRMAQNALIIAIMIIMSVTPLGYIKMPTVEITLFDFCKQIIFSMKEGVFHEN